MSMDENLGSSKIEGAIDGLELRSDEEIKWHGKPSWKGPLLTSLMIGAIIIIPFLSIITIFYPELLSDEPGLFFLYIPVIVLLPMFIVGALIGLYIRAANDYIITDKRVALSTGISGTTTFETNLENIRNLIVDQGVIARVLGIGALGIKTAGGSGDESNYDGTVGRFLESDGILEFTIDEVNARRDKVSESSFTLAEADISFGSINDPYKVHNILKDIIDEKETEDKITERIERLEDEYFAGKITEEEFEQAKRKLSDGLDEKNFSNVETNDNTEKKVISPNLDEDSKFEDSS